MMPQHETSNNTRLKLPAPSELPFILAKTASSANYLRCLYTWDFSGLQTSRK